MRRFPVPELTSRRDWMTGTRASPPPLSASSPCYPHVVPTRRTAEPLPSIRASETPPASTGDYFFQQTQLARVEPLCGCRPAEGCGTASNQSLTTVRSRPCQWRSGHVASRRVAVHPPHAAPRPVQWAWAWAWAQRGREQIRAHALLSQDPMSRASVDIGYGGIRPPVHCSGSSVNAWPVRAVSKHRGRRWTHACPVLRCAGLRVGMASTGPT